MKLFPKTVHNFLPLPVFVKSSTCLTGLWMHLWIYGHLPSNCCIQAEYRKMRRKKLHNWIFDYSFFLQTWFLWNRRNSPVIENSQIFHSYSYDSHTFGLFYSSPPTCLVFSSLQNVNHANEESKKLANCLSHILLRRSHAENVD